MALVVEVRTQVDVTIVYCVGRIVFGEETTLLREKVKALVAENPRVVVNLAGVRDIDSGGIGTLVSLFSSALARHGELKLACLSPKVSESLRITRLIGLFSIYGREEDAIAAFGSEQTQTAAAS